jgi:hypothetical protein
MIEKEVINALDRIHIILPKDVANGYVATLECIHQAIQTYQHKYKPINMNMIMKINRNRNTQTQIIVKNGRCHQHYY